VVGDDQHLKAVGKGEFDDAWGGAGAVDGDRNGHRGEAEGCQDQARPCIKRAHKLIEHRHHHGS
jgi:hypothetical protein